MHVPKERLEAWEHGKALPGISHLRRMARVYRRPLPALFLAEPPEEPPGLTDFRTVESRAAGLSPETRFAIRDARRWQETASEIAEEQGRLQNLYLPDASLSETSEQIANRIRDWLGVTPELQFEWANAREAFNKWRRAIEQRSVLVFVLPMPRDDCRGFSLWEDKSLPVIVINSQEVSEARSFTLLHELCHLMLRNTGICDQVESENGHRIIETFCNRVASFALIPKEIFWDVVSHAKAGNGSLSPEGLIDVVRLRFRTSRHVAALRLEADGYVPIGTYDNLILTWAGEEWRPHDEGGSVPIRYRYRILSEKGRLYSTILISAWKDGTLSPLEASRLMGVKAPYLAEVASELEL